MECREHRSKAGVSDAYTHKAGVFLYKITIARPLEQQELDDMLLACDSLPAVLYT